MSEWKTRYRDPVIADRTVDVMAIAFWFCYAAWGVASTLSGIPTITEATNPWYEGLWGGTVAVLASAALTAAVSTFINSQSVAVRIRKKVIEMVSVSLLAGFIAVYPVLLAMAVFIGGDWSRFATLFVAISFLIFPTWRVRHLFFRIRKLREIQRGFGQ